MNYNVSFIKSSILIVLCTSLIFFSPSCANQTSEFSSFITIPSTNSIFPSYPSSEQVFSTGIIARVKVTKIEDNDYTVKDIPRIKIYFFISNDYNQDCDSSQEYSIWFTGNKAQQIYGQPIPIIGEEYVIYNLIMPQNNDTTITASFWMEIRQEDSIEYVYPFLFDIGSYSCAESIKDLKIPVYNKSIHNDIIKYISRNNIKLPVFSYRAPLNEFIQERI